MKKFFAFSLTLLWVSILSGCASTEWKTYHSNSYWWEFQYPPDWHFISDSYVIDPSDHSVQLWDDYGDRIGTTRGFLEPDKNGNLLLSGPDYTIKNILKILNNGEHRKIPISGGDWYLMSWELMAYVRNKDEIFGIYFDRNSEIDEALWGKESLSQRTPLTFSESRELLEKIVKTFKFSQIKQ